MNAQTLNDCETSTQSSQFPTRCGGAGREGEGEVVWEEGRQRERERRWRERERGGGEEVERERGGGRERERGGGGVEREREREGYLFVCVRGGRERDLI